MFDVYNPGEKPLAFNALAEDDAGAVWCGTDEGVYRLEESPDGGVQFRHVELGIQPGGGAHAAAVTAVLKDRAGVMWVGTGDSMIYKVSPGGRVESCLVPHGLNYNPVSTLLEDRAGHIWAGTTGGGGRGSLHRLDPGRDAARPHVAQTYGEKDGLPAAGWVNSIRQTRDGTIWVAMSGGLVAFAPGGDVGAPEIQVYDEANGLCGYGPWDIAEDRDGNLWVASACGAHKFSRNGFTAYGPNDGLGTPFVNSIFEDREGALVVVNAASADGRRGRLVNRFDGARFKSVEPRLPPGVV